MRVAYLGAAYLGGGGGGVYSATHLGMVIFGLKEYEKVGTAVLMFEKTKSLKV